MERIKERLAAFAAGGTKSRNLVLKAIFWAAAGGLLTRLVLGGSYAPFAAAAAAALPFGYSVCFLVGSAVSAAMLPAAAGAGPLICAGMSLAGRFISVRYPRLAPAFPPAAAITAALLTEYLPDPSTLALVSCVIAGCLALGAYFLVAPLGAIAEGKAGALDTAQAKTAVFTLLFALGAALKLPLGGLSVGRVLAVAAFLVLIRGCGPQVAAAGGAIGGFVLATADRELMVLAAALAVGGLIFTSMRAGSAVRHICFCLCSSALILCCSLGYSSLICIYEIALASILSFFVPNKTALALSRPLAGGGVTLAETVRTDDAAYRLSTAFSDVGKDCAEAGRRLEELRLPLSWPDCAVESVCNDCREKNRCWNSGYSRSAEALCGLAGCLSGDLPVPESCFDFCARREKMIKTVGETLAARNTAVTGAGRAAQRQFSLISDLLLAQSQLGSGSYCDEQLGGRVFSLCAGQNLEPLSASVEVEAGNRREIKFRCAVRPSAEQLTKLEKDIAALCRADISPIKVRGTNGGCLLTTRSLPQIAAEGFAAFRAADGKCCGDVTLLESGENGCSYLLSDGMGTGAPAALDATMTVNIFSRLHTAGTTPELALRCACLALNARTDSESLATFDGLLIDRYAATAVFLKAGAAASYILRKGEIIGIEGGTLPVGILGDPEYSVKKARLCGGDVILMVSDGVDAELAKKELARLPGQSLKAFCEALAQQAFDTAAEKDDATVMAVQITA